MSARTVSATRVIPADAAAIFDVLADPSRHAAIDGSGTVEHPRDAPDRLVLGSTFSMGMTWGVHYITRNRVVEFEEGRRIAWHHFSQFIWRYELTPATDGTQVVETFDYSVPWGVLIEPLGWPERNRRSMEATLANLDAAVTGTSSHQD